MTARSSVSQAAVFKFTRDSSIGPRSFLAIYSATGMTDKKSPFPCTMSYVLSSRLSSGAGYHSVCIRSLSNISVSESGRLLIIFFHTSSPCELIIYSFALNKIEPFALPCSFGHIKFAVMINNTHYVCSLGCSILVLWPIVNYFTLNYV